MDLVPCFAPADLLKNGRLPVEDFKPAAVKQPLQRIGREEEEVLERGVVLPGTSFEPQPAGQALEAMFETRHIGDAQQENPVRLENPAADLKVAGGVMAALEDVVEADRAEAALNRVRGSEINLMQPAEVGMKTRACAQALDAIPLGGIRAEDVPAPVSRVLKESTISTVHVKQRMRSRGHARLQLLDLAAVLPLAPFHERPLLAA